MAKVLLLNPPGRERYIRDQFCSHVSKGTYYWQPLDLLMISGRLHAEGYTVAVVDAIAERLSADAALRHIDQFAPSAIVFLTGHDSLSEDLGFLGRVRERGGATLVGIGDVLREDGARILTKHALIDACLNDFVIHGLGEFLQGRIDDAVNMTIRTPGGIVSVPERGRAKTFTAPTPRYDLFPLDRYRMPFNRYHPYATVVTSTGCPYPCLFCPFARTTYRRRDIDDVLRDCAAIARMGIRQLHVADWTFGVDRNHARAFVEGILAAGHRFSWSCLSRVDLMDLDMLRLLKRSGCHLIEFGVESGSQHLLEQYNKGISVEEVRQTFGWARDVGLDTLATLVLGLPGETPQTLQQTLDLAIEIEPAFCSFNIASPRPGTQLRRTMVTDGLVGDRHEDKLDSSWSAPAFSTPTLPAKDLQAFQRHAIRRFYLRPSYLVRQISNLASWTELGNHVSNGMSLIGRALRLPR